MEFIYKHIAKAFNANIQIHTYVYTYILRTLALEEAETTLQGGSTLKRDYVNILFLLK